MGLRNWSKRTKRQQTTLEVGGAATVSQAQIQQGNFAMLCERHHIEMVKAEGNRVTVAGRRRRLDDFVGHFGELRRAGLV